MDPTLAPVLAALIGGVAGGSGGPLIIWWQSRKAGIEQKQKQEEEERQLRLRYVHQLRSATIELSGRMADLEHWYAKPEEKAKLLGWIEQTKDSDYRHKPDPDGFFWWCNAIGTFTMNTLYLTARYFAHAVRTRTETPFRDLNRSFSETLTNALNHVRAAINDDGYGIYEELQDSIGNKMLADGSVKTYEQFCRSFADDSDFPWYFRMLDYFGDIDGRRKENVPEVKSALNRLVEVL